MDMQSICRKRNKTKANHLNSRKTKKAKTKNNFLYLIFLFKKRKLIFYDYKVASLQETE